MSAPRLGGRFATLWAGTACANLGDGVLLVGFPLLAARLTRSPLLVSLVSTLATLPWLAVALHAGALADRHDRRRMILCAHWLRAGVLAALVLLALSGPVALPVVYMAVVVLATAEVFADTTTQSILPMVVDRDRLGAANGRVFAAQRVGNEFLGGPVAGVLVGIAAFGAASAAFFGAPAALYAAAGLALLALRGDYRVRRPSTATLRSDIAEGLRYLRHHRVLRAMALTAGLLNLANAAYFSVFVLHAVGEGSAIGLTPEGYGALFAALAAGGVGGALLTERAVGWFGEVRVLLLGAVVSSLLLLVPVEAPSAAVVVPTIVAIGLGGTMTNVVIVSLRQRLIREDLLGRVNAAYRLVGMGTMPFGAALGGLVGSLAGLRTTFVLAVAVAMGAVALAAWQVTPRRVAQAEAEVRADADRGDADHDGTAVRGRP